LRGREAWCARRTHTAGATFHVRIWIVRGDVRVRFQVDRSEVVCFVGLPHHSIMPTSVGAKEAPEGVFEPAEESPGRRGAASDERGAGVPPEVLAAGKFRGALGGTGGGDGGGDRDEVFRAWSLGIAGRMRLWMMVIYSAPSDAARSAGREPIDPRRGSGPWPAECVQCRGLPLRKLDGRLSRWAGVMIRAPIKVLTHAPARHPIITNAGHGPCAGQYCPRPGDAGDDGCRSWLFFPSIKGRCACTPGGRSRPVRPDVVIYGGASHVGWRCSLTLSLARAAPRTRAR
jgi:hypothetical protein